MFESVRKFFHNIRRKKHVAILKSERVHNSLRGYNNFRFGVLHRDLVKTQQAAGLELRSKRKEYFRAGMLYPTQKNRQAHEAMMREAEIKAHVAQLSENQ